MANTSPISALDTQENTEEKALKIMQEAYPEIDCGPGTPVYEMVIRPIAYLWSRQAMGLDELITSVSFKNYINMATEDMDRLMNRYFLTRRTGKNTEGEVRCITQGTSDIYILTGEIWETDDSRTYEVQTQVDIKKSEWEDIKPDGTPLHWYTNLTNVVIARNRLATLAELYAIVGQELGDRYIVTETDSVWEFSSILGGNAWVEDKSVTHPILYKEVPNTDKIYYFDVSVISTGKGEVYNAKQNDLVTPTGTSSKEIKSAYFLASTTDGGETENNYDFYLRAKEELAFRGMCSYKSTSAILLDNFDTIKEVVPIGIKDDEMLRDLVQITVSGEALPINIHSGGRCDIYVRPNLYFLESGYKAPLGFPMSYNEYALSDDASDVLMTNWNTTVVPRLTPQIGTRGSLKEDLSEYLTPNTNIINLKSDLTDITDFVENNENTALHTDNLVKQMWPIVVKVNIEISSENPETDIPLAKTTILEYIKSLRSSDAPQVGELAHILRAVGIQSVHIPSTYSYLAKTASDVDRPILKAYYLRDSLEMEWIGLNNTTSAGEKPTLLEPIETDSLKFQIRSDYSKQSQISLRTCTWYTNLDLINVEVRS